MKNTQSPAPGVAAEARIDVERLRERLHYDPETGIFTWRINKTSIKAGDVAGCLNFEGYIQITFDRRSYRAHRLAWLYVHGAVPPGALDHINGDRADNRMQNLRAATTAENNANHKMRVTNTSGFRGVRWDAKDRKWRADAWNNRKKHNLGRFDTPGEAASAYDAFVIEKRGAFARPNTPRPQGENT